MILIKIILLFIIIFLFLTSITNIRESFYMSDNDAYNLSSFVSFIIGSILIMILSLIQ